MKKILTYAKTLLKEEYKQLEIEDGWILGDGKKGIIVRRVSYGKYYSLSNSSAITSEVSLQAKKNAIATGCCFVEVEVDINLEK